MNNIVKRSLGLLEDRIERCGQSKIADDRKRDLAVPFRVCIYDGSGFVLGPNGRRDGIPALYDAPNQSIL